MWLFCYLLDWSQSHLILLISQKLTAGMRNIQDLWSSLFWDHQKQNPDGPYKFWCITTFTCLCMFMNDTSMIVALYPSPRIFPWVSNLILHFHFFIKLDLVIGCLTSITHDSALAWVLSLSNLKHWFGEGKYSWCGPLGSDIVQTSQPCRILYHQPSGFQRSSVNHSYCYLRPSECCFCKCQMLSGGLFCYCILSFEYHHCYMNPTSALGIFASYPSLYCRDVEEGLNYFFASYPLQ